MIIEAHPEFQGYTVVKSSDVFVEPAKGSSGDLQEPVETDMSASTQDHLRDLVKAVWRRIVSADYDTSAFEESEEFEEAMANNLTKQGKQRKTKDKALFQEAYENWLIRNS